MNERYFIGARALFLAYFFCLPFAQAQEDADSSALDWQTDIRGVDLRGLSTVTRTVKETFPVSASPELFVSNRYGDIHVTTWDNRVIRVSVLITVGAEESGQAEAFARGIDVAARQEDGRVEIQTRFPDTRNLSKVGYSVDYEISVPPDASVVIENFFGDSLVQGLEGRVTVNSSYGLVDLRDISGPVNVRAKGEFPLTAKNLQQGGTFFLRSTQAAFSDVSGMLNVSNYLGSVELRSPGAVVDMDVTAESAPIRFYVPEEGRPNLDAVADYGSIESNMLLEREVWGKTVHARSVQEESPQRIALRTSFNTIYIYREGLEAVAEPLFDADSKPFIREITQSYAVMPGAKLDLSAMTGDVRIEAGDEDRVTITAKQSVRVHNLQNVQLALEGLALRVSPKDDVLGVQTLVQDDMEALGCSAYRVDLALRVPRDMPVHVAADSGSTHVSGLRGALEIEQKEGSVRVENTDGELKLTNESGDIEARNCSGNLIVSVENGTVKGRGIGGNMEVHAEQGKTVVDSPGAGLVVRSTGGDVVVIALLGIHGNFDIVAEDGDISLAVPSSAHATFWLNAEGGDIHSTVPVTGTMDRSTRIFQGRLNDGTYSVTLKTIRGNIVVD